MSDLYILPENSDTPRKANNLREWGQFMEKPNARVVKQEWLNGDVRVSTVFLGVDHNFSKEGQPILWESMIFNSRLDQEMMRCGGTKEQAEAMHEKMVAKAIETFPFAEKVERVLQSES